MADGQSSLLFTDLSQSPFECLPRELVWMIVEYLPEYGYAVRGLSYDSCYEPDLAGVPHLALCDCKSTNYDPPLLGVVCFFNVSRND